jgi:hypothetical protein
VGDTPITGLSATPVPLSEAVVEVVAAVVALCVTVSVALRAPAVDGVKVSVTVQLPPVATVPPAAQVPPVITNSVLPVDRVPIVSAAVPVFESVAVCAVLAEPTLRLPNASGEVNVVVGAGAAVAVPLSVTAPGLPAALCAIESEPLRAPVAPAVGLNATDTVQLLPAATGVAVLQVPPAIVKSALGVIAEIDSAALPELVTVTLCAVPVEPMGTDPNASDVGEIPAIGAGATAPAPVPLSAMAIGVSVLLCEMLNVPVRLPAAVGVKETMTVQDKPVFKVVPQVPPAVPDKRAKSPLVLTAKALIAFPAAVLALTVTVCEAAVAPTLVDAKVNVEGVLPTYAATSATC